MKIVSIDVSRERAATELEGLAFSIRTENANNPCFVVYIHDDLSVTRYAAIGDGEASLILERSVRKKLDELSHLIDRELFEVPQKEESGT